MSLLLPIALFVKLPGKTEKCNKKPLKIRGLKISHASTVRQKRGGHFPMQKKKTPVFRALPFVASNVLACWFLGNFNRRQIRRSISTNLAPD